MKIFSHIAKIVYISHFFLADASLLHKSDSVLADWHRYDPKRLAQVYYARLPWITVNDAARLEQLIADIGNPMGPNFGVKSYGIIMQELMKQNRLESFKCLFSLMGDEEDGYHDVYLWLECAGYKKMESVEFMLSQGVDIETVVFEVMDMLKDHIYPEWGIDLLGWLMERDPSVAESKSEIFNDALCSIINNGEMNEEDVAKFAKVLIELGTIISDSTVEECQQRYPENVALYELLRNGQLPDFKEPDIC